MWGFGLLWFFFAVAQTAGETAVAILLILGLATRWAGLLGLLLCLGMWASSRIPRSMALYCTIAWLMTASLPFWRSQPRYILALHGGANRLHLRVHFERLVAHFAAPTGLLVTSKRKSGVEHVVAIDPDGAGA